MAVRKKTSVTKKSSPRKVSLARVSSKKSTRVSRPTVASANTYQSSNQNSVSTYLRNPRLWVGAAVVVLALLVYFYRGLFVAAVVNGQPISRLEVINELEKQSGKQTLGNLVVQTLIFQEAKKKNLTVSQGDLDSEVKKIQDQLKGQGVTLADALAARGLTQKDLLDQIKLQKLLAKMVGESVKVTDDDVTAYIEKNQDNLPQDLSEDDLRKQVKTQLEQQQLQDKTQAFVADLQKKAKINYFVGY